MATWSKMAKKRTKMSPGQKKNVTWSKKTKKQKCHLVKKDKKQKCHLVSHLEIFSTRSVRPPLHSFTWRSARVWDDYDHNVDNRRNDLYDVDDDNDHDDENLWMKTKGREAVASVASQGKTMSMCPTTRNYRCWMLIFTLCNPYRDVVRCEWYYASGLRWLLKQIKCKKSRILVIGRKNPLDMT